MRNKRDNTDPRLSSLAFCIRALDVTHLTCGFLLFFSLLILSCGLYFIRRSYLRSLSIRTYPLAATPSTQVWRHINLKKLAVASPNWVVYLRRWWKAVKSRKKRCLVVHTFIPTSTVSRLSHWENRETLTHIVKVGVQNYVALFGLKVFERSTFELLTFT